MIICGNASLCWQDLYLHIWSIISPIILSRIYWSSICCYIRWVSSYKCFTALVYVVIYGTLYAVVWFHCNTVTSFHITPYLQAGKGYQIQSFYLLEVTVTSLCPTKTRLRFSSIKIFALLESSNVSPSFNEKTKMHLVFYIMSTGIWASHIAELPGFVADITQRMHPIIS